MAVNFKKLALILTITALAACSHLNTIENVQNAPIPDGTHKLSVQEIGSTIAKAAIDRGWTVTQAAPEKLHATLARGDHAEEVNITYSAASYSITYAASQNMDQSGNMISSTYNRHIDYLNMSISKALNAAVF